LANPYTATEDDIIRYLNTIPGNQYGYATRHASFRVLKTFYKWLETKGLKYPMKNVPAPKIQEDAVLPTLRLSQIKQIIADETTKGKAIIALASASGLRKSELANIKLEDIDWNMKRIRVKIKGGKIAYAPITFSEKYLKAYTSESGKKTGSLFDMTPWGLTSYFRRLQKRAIKITGDKNIKTNAHVFRRAFAVLGKDV
jgi:integrase/recombinase XerC